MVKVDKKSIFATVTSAIGGSAIASSVGGTILSVGPIAIVGATPVGWVLGGAVLAGGAGYLAYEAIFFSGNSHGQAEYAQYDIDKDEKDRENNLNVKLNHKVISVALSLLNKLPDTFSSDSKDKLIEGLSKGVVSPFQIIDFCNKQLPSEERIVFDGAFTSIDVFIAIRLGILFSAIDSQISEVEITSLKKGVIDYFNLKELFEEEEIEEIFNNVFDGKKDLKTIENLSSSEIQYQVYLAFSQIKDNRLKEMLLEFLSVIINIDDNVHNEEKTLYKLFHDLYNYDYLNEYYMKSLEKIVASTNKNLYSTYSIDEKRKKEFQDRKRDVTSSFAKELPEKDIYFIYSDDLFGKTSKGFILTPLGIITNIAKCCNKPIKVIPYSIIKKIIDSKNKLSIICDFYTIDSKIDFDYKNDKNDFFIKFLEEIIMINKNTSLQASIGN